MIVSKEDMQPYLEKDLPEAIKRISNDPKFFAIAKYLWPDISGNEIRNRLNGIKTVKDFQLKFMHDAIRTIVASTSSGLTISGIEKLSSDKAYLFIANHRDILLDSALLQVALVENGLETSEITFGNNLMQKGFVTDLGKLNKMFTVQRAGTGRELYQISQNLSGYIRERINVRNQSIWIAQRGGRTKDGDDKTQTGLLKMLNISGTGSCAKNYNELNIIPLTVSYEYEPCDDLKTQETHLSDLHAKYTKSQNEDIESIKKGIIEFKGRIHLNFGSQIKLESSCKKDNVCIKHLAQQIDREINQGFKLWPNNYIAYDLIENSDRFSSLYKESDVKSFLAYLDKSISALEGEKGLLREIFIKMYANPVINNLN